MPSRMISGADEVVTPHVWGQQTSVATLFEDFGIHCIGEMFNHMEMQSQLR